MTVSKHEPYELPESFIEFAFMPKFEEDIENLASFAEQEEWDYKKTPQNALKPILQNFIKYTYKRIAEEKKVAVTQDEKFACWNSGLVTPSQESIFLLFEQNKLVDRPAYWHFSRFIRKGERELNRFSSLPEMAHYYDDPAGLVFDTRKELRLNIEHIVQDNQSRFPSNLKDMGVYALQNLVKGAIDSAKERAKRNYKTAVPQYFNGQIQLLLPLCLTKPNEVDLALAIEKFGDFYRATTCLTLDMAYNNARQIARPDREWLIP